MPLSQSTKYDHQFTLTIRLNMNYHAKFIDFLKVAVDEAQEKLPTGEDPAKRVVMALIEGALSNGLPQSFATPEEMLKYNLDQRFAELEGLVNDGVVEILERMKNISVVAASSNVIAGDDDRQYEEASDDFVNMFSDELMDS